MIALVLAAAAVAGATQLRMRARESYEIIRVERGGESAKFSGFANTINVHLEAPYRYAIGIAGSPLFATLRAKEPLAGFGERIRLVHLGLEGKVFPAEALGHTFLRVGAYQARMNANGPVGTPHGWSGQLGLGYEFDLGGIGLAPEFAWRSGLLDDVRIGGSAPCVGLHFYDAI